MIRAALLSAQGLFYAGCYASGYVAGHVALCVPGAARVADLIAARAEGAAA